MNLEDMIEAAGKSETKKMMVDGQMEDMVTANGIVNAAYHGWKWYNISECQRAISRYCQYISLHGCTGGASNLFKNLDNMSDNEAIQWLKETIEKYVPYQTNMVEYILGVKCNV